MRSRISAALLVLGLCAMGPAAHAHSASIADMDAAARASGNRIDIATTIGQRIFQKQWPAQVNQISANEFGGHLVIGIRMWGVKFHEPMTRAQFVAEVGTLVGEAFAAAPQAEEVDLWTSVPITVGKGVIVNGDLAKPTSRVVFGLTARRGEPAGELTARAASGHNVFWDEEWAQKAFMQATASSG